MIIMMKIIMKIIKKIIKKFKNINIINIVNINDNY